MVNNNLAGSINKYFCRKLNGVKYYIKENFDENTIKLPFWIKKVIAEIKDSNEEKWEELRNKVMSRKS